MTKRGKGPKANDHRAFDGRSMRYRDIFHLKPGELLDRYKNDDEFRAAMDTEMYVFLDDCFVLRPLALALLEMGISLDQYFPNEPYITRYRPKADYCLNLEFNIIRGPLGKPNPKPSPSSGRHSRPQHKRTNEKIVHARKFSSIDEMSKDLFSELLDSSNDPSDIDFSTRLRLYMEKADVSFEQLAELTGIADRTLRGNRSDPDRRLSLEYVVAICLALRLFPDESEKLIQAAGYSWRSSQKEKAYRYLINCAYIERRSVYEYNRFLEKMGFRRLTDI